MLSKTIERGAHNNTLSGNQMQNQDRILKYLPVVIDGSANMGVKLLSSCRALTAEVAMSAKYLISSKYSMSSTDVC